MLVRKSSYRGKNVIVIILIFSIIISGCLIPGTYTQAVTTSYRSVVKSTAPVKSARPDVRVTHPKLNTIKLSWQKIANAKGYNIYMSESKDGSFDYVSSVFTNEVVFTNLTDTLRSDFGKSYIVDLTASGVKQNKTYYFIVVPFFLTSKGTAEGTPSRIVAETANRMGIDVSHHQGNIDWDKVKKETDVQFVMIRVSDSISTFDRQFTYNMENAKRVGLKVGVYIYSRATTEAKAIEEAKYIISKLKGYHLDYPVAFDIENDVQKKLSKTTNSKIINAFCNTIKSAGYQPMVYTGFWFMNDYLDYNLIRNYPIWMSRYNSDLNYNHPVRMWQFTSGGKLPGITENTVDLNYEFHSQEALPGTVVIEANTKERYYLAKKGEMLSAIADKVHMTADEISNHNPSILEIETSLKEGQKVSLNQIGIEVVGIDAITGLTAKSSSYNSIKLTYKKVDVADGYTIYRATSKNGTYSAIGTTIGTSYTDKTVTTGKTYYYKVESFRYSVNGEVRGRKSASASAKAILMAPSKVKVTSTGYNSLQISFSKVSGATSYQVYRATSKNGSYRLIGSTTKTTYADKKRTFNKTYYYKVQAVRKLSSSNILSAKSAIASGKTSLGKSAISSATVSSRKVTLKFSKVSGASGYEIYRGVGKNGRMTLYKRLTSTKYTTGKLNKGSTYVFKVRAYRIANGKRVYSGFSSIKTVKIK